MFRAGLCSARHCMQCMREGGTEHGIGAARGTSCAHGTYSSTHPAPMPGTLGTAQGGTVLHSTGQRETPPRLPDCQKRQHLGTCNWGFFLWPAGMWGEDSGLQGHGSPSLAAG